MRTATLLLAFAASPMLTVSTARGATVFFNSLSGNNNDLGTTESGFTVTPRDGLRWFQTLSGVFSPSAPFIASLALETWIDVTMNENLFTFQSVDLSSGSLLLKAA